jgi:hypothetical protein
MLDGWGHLLVLGPKDTKTLLEGKARGRSERKINTDLNFIEIVHQKNLA